jgi:hypothetical protein
LITERRRIWRRGAHRRRSGDEGRTTTMKAAVGRSWRRGRSWRPRTRKEPLFNDIKFAVEMLKSAFRKLEGVGEAFDIKVHPDVYKDPSVKGLTFRIHGLAKKLENLPVVKRAARRQFFFDDDDDDGNHSGDNGSHGSDYVETPTN